MKRETSPRLYHELASWWPLLSTPADYEEEAEKYKDIILSSCDPYPQTLLELGCGGGNNASHLKNDFELTLTDISQEMLAVSKELNPECQHHLGDMRTIRLNQTFDVVFIHDAIMYMTNERDLRKTIETAHFHCKKGGLAIFVPDHTLETFQEAVKQGGHDSEKRSLRYLAWTWKPDYMDNSYIVDFVYMMREADEFKYEYDRHINGLFQREDWLQWIADVGFQASVSTYQLSDLNDPCELFLGLKPKV